MTFFYQNANGGTGFSSERIIDQGVLFLDTDLQASLFVDTVRLSQTFFDALRRHPVPIWEPAITAIHNNSMGLDIYVWLAYRLHVLKKPVPIRWTRLHQQFGAGFKTLWQFKPTFVQNFKLAMAVYPEAKASIEQDGAILWPSPPPVSEKLIGRVPG